MIEHIQNFKNLIIIACICTLFFCCKNEKSTSITESTYYTDSIFSSYLNEYRKHNIYLPKGFDVEKKYPIIYATDGNSNITDKKVLLDSLIETKKIKPVIFVASFSNNKIADSTSTKTGNGKSVILTYRNFEYVDRDIFRPEDSLLKNTFQNHKSYFSEELITEIEHQFNQSSGKTNRYFYGVSNGAGFGLSLLNSHPELIGTYLCFSTFGGDIQSNTWDAKTKYPDLYLRYGSDEPFFLKDDAEFLTAKYADLNLFIDVKEYKGDHHNSFWNKEFIEIISKTLN